MDNLAQSQAGSRGGPTTGPNGDRAAVLDGEDDFCLADRMALASDEELEQWAEEDARDTVSSSAYEGIPLDEALLKAELIESYQRLRAEWPTQRRERLAEIELIGRRE